MSRFSSPAVPEKRSETASRLALMAALAPLSSETASSMTLPSSSGNSVHVERAAVDALLAPDGVAWNHSLE